MLSFSPARTLFHSLYWLVLFFFSLFLPTRKITAYSNLGFRALCPSFHRPRRLQRLHPAPTRTFRSRRQVVRELLATFRFTCACMFVWFEVLYLCACTVLCFENASLFVCNLVASREFSIIFWLLLKIITSKPIVLRPSRNGKL
jgi:hypothetical protein